MLHRVNVETNCFFVGEFVSENELPVPPGPVSVAHTQEVEYLGTFVDYGPGEVDTIEFNVLLRDTRSITVRGHALQFLPSPASPSDAAAYGILGYAGGSEVLVALFPAAVVAGIFPGGLNETRASA